jgi:hypothetical protein
MPMKRAFSVSPTACSKRTYLSMFNLLQCFGNAAGDPEDQPVKDVAVVYGAPESQVIFFPNGKKEKNKTSNKEKNGEPL